jgi:hypothetical protein
LIQGGDFQVLGVTPFVGPDWVVLEFPSWLAVIEGVVE